MESRGTLADMKSSNIITAENEESAGEVFWVTLTIVNIITNLGVWLSCTVSSTNVHHVPNHHASSLLING